MKPSRIVVVFLLMLGATPALLQAQGEKIDTAAVAIIKAEGLQNSRIMELLSTLCDVYSPRLSWSPEYRRGAEWVSRRLTEWGMQNVSYDDWAPLGKGWSLKNFSAMVTAPVPFPVIAYPAAWSPGFSEKETEIVFLDVKTAEDLEKYRGKLKGKFVLISDPVDVKTRFEPYATRLADSLLLRMANADLQPGRRGGRRGPRLDRMNAQNLDSAITAAAQMFPDADTAAMRRRFVGMQMNPRKLELAQKEGALAAISAGQGDDGDVLVQAAAVPRQADAPPGPRLNPYDPKAPEIIPQVVFAAEHYNRIVRMIRQGEKVKLEMELQVTTTKADSGFNILAEIPGTDLKDEVVLLGAHFDTWHAGTGATDDNTGTAACMEAMRILQVLAEKHGLKPRRTVRIGLWGAEEQGLIGSREYVSQTYARRDSGSESPVKTAQYENLSVYFNHDNGTGRIRGIYLQGNEATRPIFRSLLSAFGDPAAQTITVQNTGGTDHQSFDVVGLPGFQFIQDPIDYDSHTHHYSMDVYERIQEPDMKQAATLMALFAYHAATREARFPRKPLTPGGTR